MTHHGHDDEHQQTGGPTPDQLEQQQGEQVRDPEAISLIDPNVAAPANVAAGLNVLSDGSTRYASEHTPDNEASG